MSYTGNETVTVRQLKAWGGGIPELIPRASEGVFGTVAMIGDDDLDMYIDPSKVSDRGISITPSAAMNRECSLVVNKAEYSNGTVTIDLTLNDKYGGIDFEKGEELFTVERMFRPSTDTGFNLSYITREPCVLGADGVARITDGIGYGSGISLRAQLTYRCDPVPDGVTGDEVVTVSQLKRVLGAS